LILNYPDKKQITEILFNNSNFNLKLEKGNGFSTNKLIYGENIEVLRRLIYDYNLKGKIDLIYIDPPFATNNIFKISDDRANSISSSNSDFIAYEDNISGYKFIEFIRERLIVLKELLSDRGSIYLHIDYKIGHYIKVIMDEIFRFDNFRNDITRIKCNPKNFSRKAFGNIKDLILFYTKTDDYIWNEPNEVISDEDVDRLFKKVEKETGRRYTTVPLHAPGETVNGSTGKAWKGLFPPKGRHWRSAPEELEELEKKGLIEWSANGVPRKKIYADERQIEGKKRQDIWEFKDSQIPNYPTEKNLELLRLIVSTSSNLNSTILDCFCGSGTTLLAAHEFGRNWIGVDKSEQALKVVQTRLENFPTDLFSSVPKYDLLFLEKTNTKNKKNPSCNSGLYLEPAARHFVSSAASGGRV